MRVHGGARHRHEGVRRRASGTNPPGRKEMEDDGPEDADAGRRMERRRPGAAGRADKTMPLRRAGLAPSMH